MLKSTNVDVIIAQSCPARVAQLVHIYFLSSSTAIVKHSSNPYLLCHQTRASFPVSRCMESLRLRRGTAAANAAVTSVSYFGEYNIVITGQHVRLSKRYLVIVIILMLSLLLLAQCERTGTLKAMFVA